jgi:hypothetical protein
MHVAGVGNGIVNIVVTTVRKSPSLLDPIRIKTVIRIRSVSLLPRMTIRNPTIRRNRGIKIKLVKSLSRRAIHR